MSEQDKRPYQTDPDQGRRWLGTLGVTALLVAVPLAALALWAGFERARLLAADDRLEASLCVTPDPTLAADLARARSEETDLRKALVDIQDRLSQKRSECRPLPVVQAVAPPPPPTPTPAPLPAPPPPRVNPPPAPPQVQPQPPAPVPPAPPALPKDRWEKKDIGLMEGCWTLVSSLRIVDHPSGAVNPVASWVMCFDKNGVGNQQVRLPNGRTCHGPLNVTFEANGKLRIDSDGDTPCTNNFRLNRIVNDCERVSDTEASCLGHEPAGPGHEIHSRFRRQGS